MLSKKNILAEGRKILAIDDKRDNQDVHFISQIEKEKTSIKLHYYMWLSRLFIFFSFVSCMYMVLACLSLFRLARLISIEPYLMINLNNSQEIVRDEPITRDMASKHQMMETFVRHYIILANTIIDDQMEMRTRWDQGGMMNFLSAPKVYQDFYNKNTKKLMEYHKEHLTREVEIISIRRQGGTKSPVWKIDFKTYDLYQSSGDGGVQFLKERFWTASVTSYFIPMRYFVGRRLINPLGFTVVRFKQSAIDIM